LHYLPYSTARDSAYDALTLPGGLIASIFYPEGIHTGRGSSAAIFVAIAGNIVAYALFWLVVVQVARRIFNVGSSPGGRPSIPKTK
jgi:hypothetical protein